MNSEVGVSPEPDYETRIRRGVALSGVQGIWAHCAGVIILGALTWPDPHQFRIISGPGIGIIALTLARAYLLRRVAMWDTQSWMRGYSLVLAATSLCWGSILAILLIVVGQNGTATIPAALITTGISAGAQAGIAWSRRLHTAYQLCLWLPPLAATLVPGKHGPNPFLTVIFSLFLLYLLRQGAHFHREYTSGLRREAELEAARRSAEVASQAKSSFVANISHEIRTPVNGLLGMLELSLMDDVPEHHRETLRTAKSSGETLLGLLNDLLDFSKIDAGRMALESIPFDIEELVTSVVHLFEPQARGKGIHLSATISGAPPHLIGDPTRLRQVLMNLTGNAIKFTDRGSVSIDVSARAGDIWEASFAVTDTGIGIARDKQPLIFEAFTQADNDTTRKFGGTGLGLAICHRLIGLMGGTLEVRSEPGRGSVFSFVLPMQPSFVPPGPARVPEPSPGIPQLRVLVVEDNLVNQRVAAGLLSRHGHQAIVVPNGAEAVAACRSGGFDVVLMDVHMPEMGGLEATRIIRSAEAGRRVPIIGLTASASDADRRECLEAGMDDYVSKPFRFEDLARAFGRVLSKGAGEPASTLPVH